MESFYFSSIDFLEDVKYQIKVKYNNQKEYAEKLGYSRKALNRILNSGDDLTVCMINLFCNDLDLKFENYIFAKRM